MKISETDYQMRLLQCAMQRGMVDATDTLQGIMTKSKSDLLKLHNRSIYQRKSDGRWVTKVGNNKRLVRANRADLEDDIVKYYLGLQQNNITFADCLTQWLQSEDHAANPSLAHKSITNYQAEYQRYIAGHDFCNLKIADITNRDVQTLLTDIINSAGKVDRKRFNSVKSLITGVFTYARMTLDIDVIPIRQTMKEIVFKPSQFVVKDQTQQVYYQHDLAVLMDFLLQHQDNMVYLGIALAAQTGLRVSEVAALSWDNVYQDHLHICNAEHSWTDLDGNRVVAVSLPKGYKIRDVMLSDKACDIIQAIRAIHPTQSGYVFLSTDGQRATCRMYDYYIRRACKQCNIPVLSMHKLRKTYASVLLASGYSDKLVQTQLGHADIATTQTHYNYNPYLMTEQAVLFKGVNVMLPPVTPKVAGN